MNCANICTNRASGTPAARAVPTAACIASHGACSGLTRWRRSRRGQWLESPSVVHAPAQRTGTPLVRVVRPAPKFDVSRRRRATGRVGPAHGDTPGSFVQCSAHPARYKRSVRHRAARRRASLTRGCVAEPPAAARAARGDVTAAQRRRSRSCRSSVSARSMMLGRIAGWDEHMAREGLHAAKFLLASRGRSCTALWTAPGPRALSSVAAS